MTTDQQFIEAINSELNRFTQNAQKNALSDFINIHRSKGLNSFELKELAKKYVLMEMAADIHYQTTKNLNK